MEILIVEDENEIAQLINSCLTREGFHCSIVYDGVSALEKSEGNTARFNPFRLDVT